MPDTGKKVRLVTGAGRGMGVSATARRLAEPWAVPTSEARPSPPTQNGDRP